MGVFGKIKSFFKTVWRIPRIDQYQKILDLQEKCDQQARELGSLRE
ncbi:MAG: hypothetical protein IH983_07950 [Planctomycetes bacterium]|nr:hypothetical protein [Planctomycetota bacterium]